MELNDLKKRFFKRHIFFVSILCGFLGCFCISAASQTASSAFVEACRAYSNGEWADAKIMLKKAVSYKENLNPDTYYMLISSELYDGDNRGALDDCNFFIEKFPKSLYYPRVCYYKGRLLYALGEYESAVVVLSDFCHQYESDDLYSYALFYIGEALFAGYKYDEAGAIYERIVTEFPESPKTPAAQYRLETILQRAREEKLLYLLKQTGEEYLAAKEDYEKQLRLYNSESVDATRQKLITAQNKNDELEKKIAELESQISELREGQAESERIIQELKEAEKDIQSVEAFNETKYQVRQLKEKALEVQKLLDSRKEIAGEAQ